MRVAIQIKGETDNGSVEVSGAIDDMHIVYWLLGEAKRIIERRATTRERKQESGIVVVPGGSMSS